MYIAPTVRTIVQSKAVLVVKGARVSSARMR